MSLSINTNASAMVAIQTLNATQSSLSTAENQVSTGLKVSNASDNAAAFGIAQQMQGNISGQSAVNDGLSFAAQTVSATNTAANQILSVLNSVQNAVTSLGNNQGSPDAMKQIGDQINGLLKQINTIAQNATFNGVNLLAGSKTTPAQAAVAEQTNDDGSVKTPAKDAVPASTSYDGIGITSGNLSYVTGLQGSTTTIGNFNATLASAVGTAGYQQASSGTTMATALGLTASAGTLNDSDATNGFVDAQGNLIAAQNSSDTSKVSISGMISQVQAAIQAMTSVTSQLGANTNTIKNMSSYGSALSDNLTNGIGALTDADMSAASAKLTSLQTKQSLAIKSLTIANSQSQNILSLFQ